MANDWTIPAAAPDRADMARRLGVPPLVAQLLINRGLDSQARASAFLAPRMDDLYPPARLPGAAGAAGVIVDAIRAGDQIVLYGDYDVDGTTGVAILWHLLRLAGAEPRFYVPHRVTEGYGVNIAAVRDLAADGAKLIITVDCGVTAVQEANVIREAGVKLVITDHHTLPPTLPVADAIVHPGLDAAYENQDLCGAGVAFKLAWAVAQCLCEADRVSPEFRDFLVEMLPLAALGTIADVVPLTGENRIIATHGLRHLARTRLPGLRALIESVGLSDARISGYDVGFKLAPRINAAGRMGHARLAVELLTRADETRAREIALYLDEHNRSRQATERKTTKQAVALIEQNNLAADSRRAIVVASEGWHTGVIGIVASRIVSRYHRPAVVITMTNGEGQGSARSIDAFDLAGALSDCEEELIAHGGHPMAAGLRVSADRLEPFTERFVHIANNRLTGSDLLPRLRLDAEVDLAELTLPTAEALDGLGPFGCHNPRPKLATAWLDLVAEPRAVGKSQDHLQASFAQNGVRLKAIGFGLASAIEDLKQHRRCRVAFEPIINEFNGRRTVEMQISDLQFPV